jgi:peroxiredoxin
MNQLKSVFISVYVTLLWLAVIHGAYMLVTGQTWHGVGVVLSALPMASFFAYIFLMNVARTPAGLSLFVLPTMAGAVVSLFVNLSDWSWLSIAYSWGVGAVGAFLYVYWYSTFADRDKTLLAVGHQMPEFVLQDTTGKDISSSSFLGAPALFIFYRGNWCPLCMAQIKEVASQYNELSRRGISVVLVSPQPHENTRALAKKFDVSFQFMVDAHNRAATKLGILAASGTPKGLEVLGYESDTVMPTVVITDAKGRILFADLTDNYRVRPEPGVFLAALDNIGM